MFSQAKFILAPLFEISFMSIVNVSNLLFVDITGMFNSEIII